MPYKDRERQLQYFREYDAKRAEKHRAYSHSYYYQHLEEQKEKARKHYKKNAEHCRAVSRRWKQNHPHIVREQHLRAYGMTTADYNSLYDRQQGCCAICGKLMVRFKLAVDHDHVTGQIRGLLCNRCNVAVGYIEKAELSTVLSYLNRKKIMDVI